MLVSAIQQCKSTITIHISLSSLASSPPPQRPSGSSESARLGSLCYLATSHQLSVFHPLVYVCWCHLLHSSHCLPPLLCPQVHSLHLRLHSFPAAYFEMFSVQSVSSVARPCPTLCNPMDCSKSGFPVHHQLLELTQTHVHWVGDAFQPSHPLSSPSPNFDLSQHQGLFKWISFSHQMAKVLEFQL